MGPMPDPRARALHDAHMIEAAFVRKLARHEAEVRRQERAREWRRLQPCIPNPDVREDPDFPGCFW